MRPQASALQTPVKHATFCPQGLFTAYQHSDDGEQHVLS